MANLIMLLGKALDSWAAQISKEYSEDMEREAKNREKASIEEKKYNLNKDFKWPTQEKAPYKPFDYASFLALRTEEAKRPKFNFDPSSFKLEDYLYKNKPKNFGHVPQIYSLPIAKTSNDKIIADKIDKLRIRQAGDHKQKMERMHAEGHRLMEKYNRINEKMMNRGFR
jgi:hypothetical protein